MAKILCYELNEVPWRVVDLYVDRFPKSSLAQLLRSGASQITTHTTDSGELHPWSTWPTMHRGVNNDEHNIRYINQDLSCAAQRPPIWDLLTRAGKSVGIAGCLQSYPPVARDEMLFHIPDTFAPESDTIPAKYSRFQSLNLKLTGENRAVAGALNISDFFAGLNLFSAGLSADSAVRLARHLVQERLNPLHKRRRATMQAYVAFDVFYDALVASQPSYAAFFSNHVAGTMHRYWKYAFPSDFGYALGDSAEEKFHSGTILHAMSIFDGQLARLMQFANENGYEVVIASSMGQEAIERGEYHPELMLESLSNLCRTIGYTAPVRMNLAMQPDLALEFEDADALQRFLRCVQELRNSDGESVLRKRYDQQGLTLNLSIGSGKYPARDGAVFFKGQSFDLADAGFRIISRDQGTGYHQPEGMLIWKGPNQPSVEIREVFDSRQYAPTVLKAMGVEAPAYMMPAISAVRQCPPQTAGMLQ
ncbi:hypothetical protein HHL11_22615 [Ramlibacter sp. G-1-2-2]|uniref:Uncharacterized protein n=1 Tax=Ramlibacter agri TaxID=2728837 RepID=A0A848H7U9_9BURK|nr:hypothetical protein [Ramlibacter agri]NML46557.1 hypothetical protein [Ramlibacter agri]